MHSEPGVAAQKRLTSSGAVLVIGVHGNQYVQIGIALVPQTLQGNREIFLPLVDGDPIVTSGLLRAVIIIRCGPRIGPRSKAPW